MGAPKGKDNFSDYRKSSIRINQKLIEDALCILRKRKLRFEGMQPLATELAERVGIHRTTLCRNPEYKRLLLSHLANQPGSSSSIRDEEATPELLQLKLFDAKLEAKVLRARVTALERELSLPVTQSPCEAEGVQADTTDAQKNFSNSVMVLKLVLERINSEYEIIHIDFEKEEISDLSAPRGRQVIATGLRIRGLLQAYHSLLEQEGHFRT